MELFNRKGQIIIPHTNFIYQIELYFSDKNTWRLEDSKMWQSKECIEELAEVQFYNYPNYKLVKYTELVAAPISWLKSNAESFEYKSSKELKQEKKNAKQSTS